MEGGIVVKRIGHETVITAAACLHEPPVEQVTAGLQETSVVRPAHCGTKLCFTIRTDQPFGEYQKLLRIKAVRLTRHPRRSPNLLATSGQRLDLETCAACPSLEGTVVRPRRSA